MTSERKPLVDGEVLRCAFICLQQANDAGNKQIFVDCLKTLHAIVDQVCNDDKLDFSIMASGRATFDDKVSIDKLLYPNPTPNETISLWKNGGHCGIYCSYCQMSVCDHNRQIVKYEPERDPFQRGQCPYCVHAFHEYKKIYGYGAQTYDAKNEVLAMSFDFRNRTIDSIDGVFWMRGGEHCPMCKNSVVDKYDKRINWNIHKDPKKFGTCYHCRRMFCPDYDKNRPSPFEILKRTRTIPRTRYIISKMSNLEQRVEKRTRLMKRAADRAKYFLTSLYTQSASKIQKHVRFFLERIHLKHIISNMNSIIRIQSVARGYIERMSLIRFKKQVNANIRANATVAITKSKMKKKWCEYDSDDELPELIP